MINELIDMKQEPRETLRLRSTIFPDGSVHLPDEDIKEQSMNSSRHLRYVGVREKRRVVSADAREKEERDIAESHHRQRRQRSNL